MPETRFKFKLQEKSSEFPKKRLKGIVKVNGDGDWLEIYVEGFGEKEAEDGEGSIVHLELYEGQLRVLVRPDICATDPVIHEMDGARETLRGSSPDSSCPYASGPYSYDGPSG
jgi:hypothetical protein